MAIKFKEINDRLEKSPLSDGELAAIDYTEKDIDSQILTKFKGHELNFNLDYCQFKRTSSGESTAWPDVRRKMMYEELKKRYTEAGWICTEKLADSQDRYGQDYLELKGRNK